MLREIGAAVLLGVFLLLVGAVMLARRWGRRIEEQRKAKLPASLRGN